MNTQQYREVRKEIGKDAAKTMAFFFLGVPAIIAAIVLAAFFGVAFLVPATLGTAGVLWLLKRRRTTRSA